MSVPNERLAAGLADRYHIERELGKAAWPLCTWRSRSTAG